VAQIANLRPQSNNLRYYPSSPIDSTGQQAIASSQAARSVSFSGCLLTYE